jgi:ParB/RepB/Spo0J family partition protein
MENKIEMIAVADVIPTPDNPRVVLKDDPKIVELATSITNTGLLQPVVCRPHPTQEGKYDLRAGFRRYLAHKRIGAETIMAIVRDMDDATAMEVTVLENLQREQLSPLEEARGVQQLLDTGHSALEIAADVGKSIGWVYRRASLTKLCPELVEMINDPDSDWNDKSAAVLEIIARLPEERQKEFANNNYMADSAEGVKNQLQTYEHELSAAPWDLEDISCDGCLPCSTCPKRTSVQPFLFPEYDHDKHDRCLDPDCWQRKHEAFIARIKEHAGEEVVLVQSGYNWQGEHALEPYKYDKAKRSDPKAQRALMVDGADAGKLIWIKSNSSPGAEGKTKMPSLELRRKAWIIKHVESALMAKDAGCPVKGLTYMAALTAEVGTQERAFWARAGEANTWTRINNAEVGGDQCVIKKLWAQVKLVLCSRLRYMTVSDCGRQYAEALAQADLLDLGDEKKLMALATEALPGKAVKADKKQKRKGK